MQLAEAQSAQTAQSWSAEEELIIATIRQTESVQRPEAIRRMQRRRKLSSLATALTSLQRGAILANGRLCRNSRCTRGEHNGPGSLAHLRAEALYCNAACKKAAQRSPNRENRASNRQCLCGPKRDKSRSLLSPPYQPERGAQIVRNRNLTFIRRAETRSPEAELSCHGTKTSRTQVSHKYD